MGKIEGIAKRISLRKSKKACRMTLKKNIYRSSKIFKWLISNCQRSKVDTNYFGLKKSLLAIISHGLHLHWQTRLARMFRGNALVICPIYDFKIN